MAKFLISHLLLATFLLNLLDVGLLILHFELNRDTFAELCINKDKEEMHCNGHCQLEKQFREYETEQPSEKEKAVPQKENSPFLCSCFPFINWNNFATNKPSPIYLEALKQNLGYFDIFHPPRA